MKAPPKIGDGAEIEFVVDGTHVIDFAEEQMPAVLSTPCLIGYLERTARKTLAPCWRPANSPWVSTWTCGTWPPRRSASASSAPPA